MENNIYRLNWCHFNWLEWCLSPHYFAHLPEGKSLLYMKFFSIPILVVIYFHMRSGPTKMVLKNKTSNFHLEFWPEIFLQLQEACGKSASLE